MPKKLDTATMVRVAMPMSRKDRSIQAHVDVCDRCLNIMQTALREAADATGHMDSSEVAAVLRDRIQQMLMDCPTYQHPGATS